MPHDVMTLIRHHAEVDGPQAILDALEATGYRFSWAMGQLAWHDEYWETVDGALPGAFLEACGTELFARSGISHLSEAVFAGPEAQVLAVAGERGIRLALMYEADEGRNLREPWSEGEPLENLQTRNSHTLAIQNTNVFGYAAERGSFDSPIFKELQQSGIQVREYLDAEQVVAWRLLVNGSDMT